MGYFRWLLYGASAECNIYLFFHHMLFPVSLASITRLILRITAPILLLASISTAAEEPRRVLLLDSFEKEFAPFDVFKATFRNELADQFPVAFYELSVDPARLARDTDERFFLSYVLSTFKEHQMDLVITIGGPATRFAQKYRDQLFASTPLLFALVDERNRNNSVTRNSTTVAVLNDAPRMIETILQVLPETKNIVVVVGRSPLEQFWRAELGREFQRFDNQLTFTWFDNLPFAEMLNRSATLSANTAIFYPLLYIDAEGVAYTSESALSELRAKANAPIFGVLSPQLGKGIVGGPLLNIEDLSRKTANIAVRLLNKEAPESITVPPQMPGPAVFDWRELRRWNIDEHRLPPGSMIRFRSSTPWDEYKWYVIVGGSLSVFGAILVVGLAIHLVKRKRVERSLREAERLAHDFSRRLIQAQEVERSNVAHALHDDINQRLACIAIEIGQEETAPGRQAVTGRMTEVRKEIVQLSKDVSSMAYELHPSLLEYLGLVTVLKAECEKLCGQADIAADAKFENIPDKVPVEVALGLFRVAQEALRNVSRHSRGKAVIVQLTAEKGGMQLVITDDGIGFDSGQLNSAASLGLASMRQRVQLLGGNLDIQSKPGHGTTISAWIPLIQGNKRPPLAP
jgi:signal transduction histidine kinase